MWKNVFFFLQENTELYTALEMISKKLIGFSWTWSRNRPRMSTLRGRILSCADNSMKSLLPQYLYIIVRWLRKSKNCPGNHTVKSGTTCCLGWISFNQLTQGKFRQLKRAVVSSLGKFLVHPVYELLSVSWNDVC